MDLSKVTIIIPSYKRHEYAINALKYWSKYEVDLHLVDGSDNPILNIDEEIKNSRIKYHHIKILSEVDRIKKILPLIKTKYTILSSDDDLLLPKALSNCLEEIEKDDDIISCYGQTLSFYKIENTTMFQHTDYKLINFKNVSNSSVERINKHMNEYVPSIVYSVMPTDIFQNIFEVENPSEYEYLSSMELRVTLLITYYGKSKTINDLLVLRRKSGISAITRNSQNTSFFRTMFLPKQKSQRIKFINDLIISIKKREKKDAEALKKIFNSAFKKYFFFTLKIFLKKGLFMIIINNIFFLYFMRRKKKFRNLLNFDELSSFCNKKNINLSKIDHDLMKNIFLEKVNKKIDIND